MSFDIQKFYSKLGIDSNHLVSRIVLWQGLKDSQMARLLVFVTAFVAAAAFAAAPANATTIDWLLSGVVFDDGGAAGGTFSTDSSNGNVIDYDITTTPGTAFGGVVYNSTAANMFSLNGNYSPNSFLIDNFNTNTYVNLEFVNPLTGPGIDSLIFNGNSYECDMCAPVRSIISGEAIATPLPAALPLFATGLGALGLFGWYKKRRVGPTAAVSA